MWDLIVSVPDHCLSFYFTQNKFLKIPYDLQGIVFQHVTYITTYISFTVLIVLFYVTNLGRNKFFIIMSIICTDFDLFVNIVGY